MLLGCPNRELVWDKRATMQLLAFYRVAADHDRERFCAYMTIDGNHYRALA